MDRFANVVSHLLRTVEQIHAGVASGSQQQSTTYYIPEALVSAFNPLILFFCISSQIAQRERCEWTLIQQHWAEKCHRHLIEGKHQLIFMIQTGDYSDAKIFKGIDSEGIITMVIERLVKKPSGTSDPVDDRRAVFNLLETYRDYISRMVYRFSECRSCFTLHLLC